MKSILLIDDEPGIRITFKKMLEKENYTVITASNLSEAKEDLKNHQFDTIISDILLPGTSGIEVLKIVKETSPQVPVIMITGEPNINTAIESVRQGAYDYLSKPITRHQLIQVVGKAVEKKWLIDERKRLEKENTEYQRNLENKVRERTNALEQLNAFINNIMESIPSMIVTLDPGGCITMVNTNTIEFFHYQDKAKIIGRNYHSVFPQNLTKAIEEVSERNDWTTSHECIIDNKIIGYNVSLLLNRRHEIMGKVIIMKDISEKKKLEQELIQSEKLATLGLLAGKISHEMGNPLFGIFGYAELLEVKYPQEPDIKHIINQALRLKKMTRDLLTISKPKPPRITSVDLNNILQQTIDFLKDVTGQIKYHNIVSEFSPSLPPIQGDEEQLKQVFMNLIINASQSMKDQPEQGILTLGTCLNKQEYKIVAYVQDTGCGIAPEDLNRIFDPFYSTKGDEGTGLGMSVVKEIINNHHGQIYIKSKAGQGTKISVSLPI